MPELPEVETVVRGLRPVLEARTLARVQVRRGDLRKPLPPDFASRLKGRRIASVSRRAKYILAALEDGNVLLIHLGMPGRLVVRPPEAPPPAGHDHVIFETNEGLRVVFNDPRRFGLMDLFRVEALEDHPLLCRLGPEPLSNAFNGPVLSSRLRGRKTPIKAALMDQRTVAGLGNIYVCEALFRAGISPRRGAASVAGVRAERLVAAIRAVLEDAIAAGGSSLRDFVGAGGKSGYFQHRFDVYGRAGESCRDCTCESGIRRLVQGGRSSFYCPVRQR